MHEKERSGDTLVVLNIMYIIILIAAVMGEKIMRVFKQKKSMISIVPTSPARKQLGWPSILLYMYIYICIRDFFKFVCCDVRIKNQGKCTVKGEMGEDMT